MTSTLRKNNPPSFDHFFRQNNIMNKNLLPAFIALFALLISQPVSAQTPEATNVKIQTLGNRIRITYELTGASKYHRLSVRPLLVMPDSSINADAIKSATGIGPIPSINGPQFIEWDWSKDLPALPPGFDI
ncbi:MAG: hypothetical protein JNK89_02780, partial [Saprospiraceae bacterium]|nr:hypothetical protein [Saprospiraceae bacterium]